MAKKLQPQVHGPNKRYQGLDRVLAQPGPLQGHPQWPTRLWQKHGHTKSRMGQSTGHALSRSRTHFLTQPTHHLGKPPKHTKRCKSAHTRDRSHKTASTSCLQQPRLQTAQQCLPGAGGKAGGTPDRRGACTGTARASGKESGDTGTSMSNAPELYAQKWLKWQTG